MSDKLLVARGVAKSYPGAPDVLTGVDLELDAGESLAIVGPSGSGKSTLLNILGTLETPSAGSVEVAGRDVLSLAGRELARFRNRTLGFVFQHHHLLPQLGALENVLLPTLAEPGEQGGAHGERARELLERVGLGERLVHRPAQLSGGERQRVAVVRALLLRPALILADEPTGSLDGRTAAELGELLAEQCAAEGAALLVVTHAQALAERLGSIAALGPGGLEPLAPAAG